MNLADKIHALYAEYGSLKGVTVELYKQLIAITVKNEAASATIFLQGAQLAEYKRVGERPLLWLSDECDFKAGASLRGGIPICWPWFGELDKNPESVKSQINQGLVDTATPAHGFVRDQLWDVEAVELVDSETTKVTLNLDLQPSEIWPYAASLRLVATVGVELDVKLSVHNSGSELFNFTSAFHTYLNLSTVNACEVSGLEGKDYFDTLKNWSVRSSSSPIAIDQELDQVYSNVAVPVMLKDPQFGRSVTVTPTNAPDLVVWNPWVEKSKRLSHFDDQAYKQMICLETACLLDNAVSLSAGESVTMGLNLSIS
jgi:glucose-6-phosphate 1-epimerase